jgi:hypothetical protein
MRFLITVIALLLSFSAMAINSDNRLIKTTILEYAPLTTAERDALPIQAGQVVWNTTTGNINLYSGGSWQNIASLTPSQVQEATQYATGAQNGILSSTDWTSFDAKVDFGDLSTVATSGAYADLSGKPVLATVATSGAYADLSGKPTLLSQFTNDSGFITASGFSSKLLHVSKDTGNDANTCTFTAPCLTIQRAINVATAIPSTFNTPVVIKIYPAKYTEDLTFSQQGITLDCVSPLYHTNACQLYGGVTIDLSGTAGGANFVGANNVVSINGLEILASGSKNAILFSGSAFQRLYINQSYVSQVTINSSFSALLMTNSGISVGTKSTITSRDTDWSNDSSTNATLELQAGRIFLNGASVDISNSATARTAINLNGSVSSGVSMFIDGASVTGLAVTSDNTAVLQYSNVAQSCDGSVCITGPSSPSTGYFIGGNNLFTTTNTNVIGGTGIAVLSSGNYCGGTGCAIAGTVTQAPLAPLVQGALKPSSLQISGLTASLPVKTDASKNLVSAAINLASATEVTGSLPVNRGGTGLATLTTNNLLVGAGTSNVTFIAPSTSGNVLTSNGTTWISQAPAASGITSLNGSSLSSQTFATGTSGTDFAISTATGVHTFNLPLSSAANTGKLSSTDWTTFNNKQASGNYITALTGDVTASGPNSAVATIAANAITTSKILNGAVDLTSKVSGILPRSNGGTGLAVAGTVGNVLTSDGTNWTSAAPSVSGITSLNGESGASQTFATGTSGTDFNISSASGVHTFNIPIADGTNTGKLSSADWASFSEKVDGPVSAVDGEVALFDGATGKLIKSATGTGVAHLVSGVLSTSDVNLTSEVTGILPIANGGTGVNGVGSLGMVLTSDGSVASYQSVVGIQGSRSSPRKIQAVGITLAAGHIDDTLSSQDIYVCGSSSGASCDASITALTIAVGQFDGQRVCIIGRDDTNTVTLSNASTTNIELNGTAVLGQGDTLCLRWDTVKFHEISRSF